MRRRDRENQDERPEDERSLNQHGANCGRDPTHRAAACRPTALRRGRAARRPRPSPPRRHIDPVEGRRPGATGQERIPVVRRGGHGECARRRAAGSECDCSESRPAAAAMSAAQTPVIEPRTGCAAPYVGQPAGREDHDRRCQEDQQRCGDRKRISGAQIVGKDRREVARGGARGRPDPPERERQFLHRRQLRKHALSGVRQRVAIAESDPGHLRGIGRQTVHRPGDDEEDRRHRQQYRRRHAVPDEPGRDRRPCDPHEPNPGRDPRADGIRRQAVPGARAQRVSASARSAAAG